MQFFNSIFMNLTDSDSDLNCHLNYEFD